MRFCKKKHLKKGFDHVFNYKICNWSDELKKVAPNGIDIFIDMIGDEYYTTAINTHMKHGGRVLVVGSMRNYNDKESKTGLN